MNLMDDERLTRFSLCWIYVRRFAVILHLLSESANVYIYVINIEIN